MAEPEERRNSLTDEQKTLIKTLSCITVFTVSALLDGLDCPRRLSRPAVLQGNVNLRYMYNDHSYSTCSRITMHFYSMSYDQELIWVIGGSYGYERGE